MRVVSLLPSATEIVHLLGAGDQLVGRSHECDFPSQVSRLPALTAQAWDSKGLSPAEIDEVVSQRLARSDSFEEPDASGGRSLYRLDEDRLHELRPDLIITQDLCAVCSIDLGTVRRVAARLKPQPAILSLNPHSFEDVFDDILAVGRALGVEQHAVDTVVAFRERFFRTADFVNAYERPKRVVFLEWTDPLFVGGHWTPQLVERAGGSHLLNPTHPMEGAGAGAGGQMAHRVAGPSVRVTPEQVIAVEPEAIVVCPCGVRLENIEKEVRALQRQAWWGQLPAVRSGRVAMVDGNQMFNRPGPRLVDAYQWLVGWLNGRPELIPPEFPWREIQ